MRRQPRMMTALYAGTRLRAMLDIVLFESIAADAGQIAVNVETDGDRVRLEILSDATHTDDAAHLRNAIKAGAHTPATVMVIQVATIGPDRRRLTWTAPELDRSQDENQAAREKDHGSTGSTKGMEKGHARVQLEYRQNAADAGSRAAWIVAEAARYTPARVAIFHNGVTIIDREDYLKNAVAVKDEFLFKLVELTETVAVGDPTEADTYMGPMVGETAYEAYQRYVSELGSGRILTGGQTLPIGKGYYVAPTVVTDLPEDHRLWQHEMFAPIVTVRAVDSPDEAMRLANDVALGLTAGFYSEDQDEVDWFLENMEAGVLYVNRETGATTGAWPGYQSFGGWKGSTGSNKASGSYYYLQQYMREQSHTIVGG